jgi:uncharacterized protein
MYLVGASHPHKVHARQLLERLVGEGERLVTDAAALQEILHRYASIERRDFIQPAFDALLSVVDAVFPVEVADVERAKAIILERRRVSARDAIHVAVMQRRGIGTIMSFDTGFDGIPGLTRIGPPST